jgi:hypothetical protein
MKRHRILRSGCPSLTTTFKYDSKTPETSAFILNVETRLLIFETKTYVSQLLVRSSHEFDWYIAL